MLKQEFLKLMQIEDISDETYLKIESVYNQTDDDKQYFCSQLKSMEGRLNIIYKLSERLRRVEVERDKQRNEAETLAKKVLLDEVDADDAYHVLGTDKAIAIKLDNDDDLSDDDKNYIKTLLKK